jgi:hypothetical protein
LHGSIARDAKALPRTRNMEQGNSLVFIIVSYNAAEGNRNLNRVLKMPEYSRIIKLYLLKASIINTIDSNVSRD